MGEGGREAWEWVVSGVEGGVGWGGARERERETMTFLQRLEYLPQLVFFLANCRAAGGNGVMMGKIDGVRPSLHIRRCQSSRGSARFALQFDQIFCFSYAFPVQLWLYDKTIHNHFRQTETKLANVFLDEKQGNTLVSIWIFL